MKLFCCTPQSFSLFAQYALPSSVIIAADFFIKGSRVGSMLGRGGKWWATPCPHFQTKQETVSSFGGVTIANGLQ
jgi:hypothetical protein